MHEIERLLRNFLFAARRIAAADAGHFPKAAADEIADCAVRDLTIALTTREASPDPLPHSQM
jgi:hypothetical protein